MAKARGEEKPYDPRTAYAAGEVVVHSRFGKGVVAAVKSGGKVEVIFKADIKTLVHARG